VSSSNFAVESVKSRNILRAAAVRAVVEHLEGRQLLEVLLQHLADAQHECVTLMGLETAPWTFEGAAGAGDRELHVFLAAARQRRQDLTGGRIEALDALAARRGLPPAIDEVGLVRIRQERRPDRRLTVARSSLARM